MAFLERAVRGRRALAAPPIGMLVVLAGCARAGVLPDDGGSRDVIQQDGGPTDAGDGAIDAAQDALPRVDAFTDTDASMNGDPDGATDAAAGPDAMPDAAEADAQVDATVPQDTGAEDTGSDAAEDGDTDSPCVPGTYAGTFEGEVTVGPFGLEIEGDLQIVVMPPAPGSP